MIDQEAGRPLNGDRDLAGQPVPLEPGDEAGKPFPIVTGIKPI